ncbi:microtubule-actin cross-linking factor 1-like [Takifugu rubripes]|uniref:microtubule-actin cross-linking factor 1-like n=1 Tax=Takifugu rubripes TaxID=31033 RepID=UPI0011454AB8|nr:microtubule-actin cross-linking factor 1-like [Takifugu rubripes]
MEEESGPKKNPLIRASSEERSSDPKCCSSPGDTLPWNLPRHHRMKRSKSASGDVLDPAERAVIRIAGKCLRRLKACEESEVLQEWLRRLLWRG